MMIRCPWRNETIHLFFFTINHQPSLEMHPMNKRSTILNFIGFGVSHWCGYQHHKCLYSIGFRLLRYVDNLHSIEYGTLLFDGLLMAGEAGAASIIINKQLERIFLNRTHARLFKWQHQYFGLYADQSESFEENLFLILHHNMLHLIITSQS